MFSSSSRFAGLFTAIASALAIGTGAVVRAQEYPAGDVQQTVARISYLSGNVSYSRGDEPDAWQPAALNVPMTIGDRVYTGSGRTELEVEGAFIRIDAQSDLSALNLTDDVRQFSLQSGTASFDVRRLGPQEAFEVDTPNVAVSFERPGQYRVDVDQDGNSRVSVRSGSALVAAGGGQVPLSAGNVMEVTGVDSPQYDIVGLSAPDAWDRWVDLRQTRFQRARSYAYVNARVVGAEDLDQYGRWSDVPGYGRCWSPSSVSVGWQPYRAGHWGWQDPWGWTWISFEPWGWAPYHYGRWVTHSSRWFWVPVAPSVSFVAYAPALVAFVGGGPGWSASLSFGGGGYVGWFPLAPRDPFNPWWGERARGNVGVTNVTYVNRNYVTVVNHNTFVSGGVVTQNQVRDASVLRQVSAAPVIRGPVPVVPSAQALRVSRQVRPAARPPVALTSRPVVTRLAPAPAPPSFQAKVAAIRENRGAPVAPAAAARMSVQGPQGARARIPVRPAAAAGQMTFKAQKSGAPRPQPITAPAGRVLATPEHPVASPSPRPAPGRSLQPLAPRTEAPAPPQKRVQTSTPPPQRTVQPSPERRVQPLAPRTEAPTPPQKRVQTSTPPPQRTVQPSPERRVQPLAPRTEAPTPPQKRVQTSTPPPQRTVQPSPERRVQPLAPRTEAPTPPQKRVQTSTPPPQRMVQPSPERRVQPLAPRTEAPTPPQKRVQTRTPPPQVESRPAPRAAAPGEKNKPQKKPVKKEAKPKTSTEPPPRT